jgi:hypothetical protein
VTGWTQRLRVARLVAALAGATALLVFAVPAQTSPPAAAPTGPLPLAQRWPAAKVASFPATLANGDTYAPLLFLSPTSSVGTAMSVDLTSLRLMLRTASGDSTIQTLTGQQQPSIVGMTVSAGRLYWLETGPDINGSPHTTVWRYDPASGALVTLAKDGSSPMFIGSQYDTQVVGGRIYWISSDGQSSVANTQLRSVPIEPDAGAEEVRPLDAAYTMMAWPWVTTANNGTPGPVRIMNLETAASHVVAAGGTDILTCSPVWCLVTRSDPASQDVTVRVERADGTGARPLGDATMTPVCIDIGLLDRYEVLSQSVGPAAAATVNQRLWLDDLNSGELTLLSAAASASFGAHDGVVWWSTGDNETLTWHVLDLRTLH